MTESEIKSLYYQIEGLSTSEIQSRVDQEFSDSVDYVAEDIVGAAATGILGYAAAAVSLVSRIFNRRRNVSPEELKAACNKSWNLNITQIRTIIDNNPKTSRCIMDIVILLAPAIAQQYTGMSGMAIVGTLTIICKQNLGL